MTTNYDEQINNIKTTFFSALDDFQKYYVYYNKNPEVSEFQNYYTNSKGQLQQMSTKLLYTTSEMSVKIDNLNDDAEAATKEIEKQKKEADILLTKMENVRNNQNGSSISITDSIDQYNTQYYKNWIIFIGIHFIVVAIFLLFKTSPPTK